LLENKYLSFYIASEHTNYWKGCITSLIINHILLVDSALPSAVSYFSRRVTAGCHGDQQCLSAAACPRNANCRDEWNDYSCECKEGEVVLPVNLLVARLHELSHFVSRFFVVPFHYSIA